MIMSIALAVHLLSIIIWVGGMFFAHQVMRPAVVEILDPPYRLRLWVAGFKRFFPWVWLCIILVLASGLWMMFQFPKPPIFMHIMLGLCIIMMLIFMHVFFAPYNRLKKAVIAEEWKDGAAALGQIRTMVGINTIIGIITVIVATAGKYYI
ncbi:MAG: CopD family protein [Cocleimonas sp.]